MREMRTSMLSRVKDLSSASSAAVDSDYTAAAPAAAACGGSKRHTRAQQQPLHECLRREAAELRSELAAQSARLEADAQALAAEGCCDTAALSLDVAEVAELDSSKGDAEEEATKGCSDEAQGGCSRCSSGRSERGEVAANDAKLDALLCRFVMAPTATKARVRLAYKAMAADHVRQMGEWQQQAVEADLGAAGADAAQGHSGEIRIHRSIGHRASACARLPVQVP